MKKASYSGFGISLVGAALDFASSYSLVMMAPTKMMGFSLPLTAIGVFLLGVVVLLSGVLIVHPRTSGAMPALGLLMEILGAAMALVSYWVTGMTALLSYSMLIVGGAMILNGWLMQRGAPMTRQELEGQ